MDALGLTEEARGRLREYRDLLLRWNQRFNLTAIREAEAIDRLLIGDALAMLPAVDDAIAAARAGRRGHSEGERPLLVDVGSGAGFPALVLKVARPEIDLTMMEATRKKVGFLEHVILALGLDRATALHGRAEEFGQQDRHRGRYDIVTARAVAALPALMELCLPLLRVGGVGLFPKGMELAGELAEGSAAADVVGGRIVSSNPIGNGTDDPVTRLVVAVKLARTPQLYPRRSGLPAKEPLGRFKP